MESRVIATLMFVCTCFASPLVRADEPLFAAHASTGTVAASPDGKSTVSLRLIDDNANDFPTDVKVRTGKRTLTSSVNFGLNAEILWSQDSRAFTLTGSSGGGMGQYHTDVFIIRSNRLIRLPLTHLIEEAFGHPVKCGWPEVPNVAAIKWLETSRTVLVAAEIIPHSNCDSFGTFRAFVVNLQSQRIVRTYDQLTVKRLYGADLGRELREANDSCIRNPQTCFVSTNHPESK